MESENTIRFNRIFYPVSFFYRIGVWFRNFMFNKGILSSEQFPIPVICVGNLTVGGTGKTPHTEYIIRLLKDQYKVAVLSRGYKRKTKGFLLASPESSSKTIGDEPYQIKLKFPEILVAVDENRRRGIRHLLALPEEQRPDVILLDDGYQHRYVVPSLSILLTDYHRLFYQDKLLPVGRLRESKSGALRADIVMVTKCDTDLHPIDYRILEENLNLWSHQLLYFTHIEYGELTPVFPEETVNRKLTRIHKEDTIILLAGIAKPELFQEEIGKYSENILPFIFADHHNYSRKDIKKINEAFKKHDSPNTLILTTEKDAVRLRDNKHLPAEWKSRLYYLPITVHIQSKNYAPFNEVIIKHVSDFKKSRI
ncbi:MAG: tetraacyldisaccharide 4'-kinase [Tannerellaceae bacterium]|nr:tetraacyldisaccharide 4'-kinase [Tannerellaceae bacterium]